MQNWFNLLQKIACIAGSVCRSFPTDVCSSSFKFYRNISVWCQYIHIHFRQLSIQVLLEEVEEVLQHFLWIIYKIFTESNNQYSPDTFNINEIDILFDTSSWFIWCLFLIGSFLPNEKLIKKKNNLRLNTIIRVRTCFQSFISTSWIVNH